MTTYYRNRETGQIQAHPVSGLGESFNSDEVGEDAKPITALDGKAKKPRAPRKPAAPKKPEAIADGETPKTEEAN